VQEAIAEVRRQEAAESKAAEPTKPEASRRKVAPKGSPDRDWFSPPELVEPQEL